MFHKNIWVPILILFLVVMGVGLFYRQKVAKQEPVKIYKTIKVEEPTAKPKSPKPTAPDTPVLQRPTPGHFHEDGTFHAQTHERPVDLPSTATVSKSLIAAETISPGDYIFVASPPPAGIAPDWASMSPDGLSAFTKAVSESRIDPPEGYDYKRNSDGSVLLDGNGYPVLHKRGEPFFSISWGTGFRPTPEQYAEYKAAHKKYMDAWKSESPEFDRLASQLKEMRRTYVGPVPGVGYSFAVPADTDMKAYHKKYDPITSQLRREAYRKAGLGYMID